MHDSGAFSPEEMQVLLPLFRTSGDEYIGTMRRVLGTLGQPGERGEALTLFHRAAHSLKGAALQLGFVHIGILAQAMEAVASHARTWEGPLPPECAELFARGADCLEGYLDALEDPDECDRADGDLLHELQVLGAHLSQGHPATGSAGAK
jgi:chemotaxis protein histidine kinase CheA